MGFLKTIYDQHDVVCNQKYGEGHPYSFHLQIVVAQGKKFMHLLPDSYITNSENFRSKDVHVKDAVLLALVAHDVIEDGRLTYNNVLELALESLENYKAAEIVAEIVYCVTDEKGRNRKERKNDKYYQELSENKLALFVKLSDLAANTMYSKMTGHKMYDTYKKEFVNFKEKLYTEEYKEFFDYIENI